MATIDIDSELQNEVRRIAATEKRSASSVLRDAVRQYAERQDMQRNFLAEAEESLSRYRQDGLHLTGEETRDWLRQWGDESGAKAPGCHE